jgi:zinc protease
MHLRHLLAASAAWVCLGALAQSPAPADSGDTKVMKADKADKAVRAAKPAAKNIDIPTIAVPDITYTKFVLKNGLTLLVHEDHKTPVVAVNTWYHVGSKNELPGKTGFAHLFEHLMFSGSDNFNHTYINAMEQIGATSLNGTTNPDRTNFFENVPTSMLDYALFAESDRMGHLLGVLDQKKLDLQRGVVQNEKRQGENQPYGVTRQLLTENTYPVGHPYSWTTIGSMQDLDAASMKDVQDWFKTSYGPNNAVLVLAGDITPQEALQKVEKYYGEIAPVPPLAKQSVWIAKRTGTHRETVQDRVPQARLYRVWNVPQADTPEEASLDLVAQVLGAGKTSRLYKRLVYKDQIATAATASDDTREIGGQFSLTLTAAPGIDLQKVEAAADEELQNFLKNGPTEEELQLAKTAILGNYVRTMERVGGFGGKSDVLARCQTFAGKPDCYKDYLKRIQDATPASVAKAANAWLSDGDFVLEVHPYPTNYETTARLDRSKEPEQGKAENLNLPPMQTATLSNGLKIVLAERHNAPIVNFSMLVNSGYSSDTTDNAGLASLSVRMLEEGTSTRDSLKISAELDALSASYSAATYLDSAVTNLNVLKATMPQALDIYADLLLHPTFPEKEFERLKKDRLAAIRRDKVTPNTMATRVLPTLLYGKEHPYAMPQFGLGYEASVGKLTREDLVKFHRTWFKSNNATLLIVGDTTLAEIKPQLEHLFGAWKSGDVQRKPVAVVNEPAKTEVYLIDRPDAKQSMIVGAQLVPPTNNPDEIPFELVNGVFGGSFSARINMNLREDKHWSYGVRSFASDAIGQRTFMSVSPVQFDKTKDALQQLEMEYRNIAGGKPIAADELRDVQANDTLSLPGSFETVGQLARNYANILQFGLDPNYYNTYTQKILAVTPDQSNALAQRLIRPDHMIWIVVGDMSKVEAGIRELNLGEVHKIDADGNPVK